MRYFGGKNLAGTYQKIINLIPEHRVYIEPFAGSAAIARMKRPAKRDIVCELSSSIDVSIYEGLEFHQGDGLGFVKEFVENYRGDPTDIFIYADPPYLWSTRKSRKRYEHDWPDETHISMLQLFSSLGSRIAISGYPSDLYENHLWGWHCETWEQVTRSGKMATECLWMNYDPPEVPATLDYVGSNFTERQRIKRKADRYVKRFSSMPADERSYIVKKLYTAGVL